MTIITLLLSWAELLPLRSTSRGWEQELAVTEWSWDIRA